MESNDDSYPTFYWIKSLAVHNKTLFVIYEKLDKNFENQNTCPNKSSRTRRGEMGSEMSLFRLFV